MTSENKECIVIVGTGNREHALANKLAINPDNSIYVVPGNKGMKLLSPNIMITNDNKLTDYDIFVDWLLSIKTKMVIIGSEEYIDAGLSDRLMVSNIPVIAPSKTLSRIESSKLYGKELMKKYDILTPDYVVYESLDELVSNVDKKNIDNNVLKLNGLSRGKGVFLPNNYKNLVECVNIINSDELLNGGSTIIYEKKLKGIEFSLHAFCDTETALFMPLSKDYKKIGDGECGLNTGGMGSFSNFKLSDITECDSINEQLDDLKQNLQNLVKDLKYHGILYVGCMISDDKINVLEFNCRFGDPETQSIIQTYSSDHLTQIFECMLNKSLRSLDNKLYSNTKYLTVVLSHDKYPLSKSTDNFEFPLTKIVDSLNSFEIPSEFYTACDYDGTKYVSKGGRIGSITFELSVDGHRSIYQQILKINELLSKISYDGIYYRHDIGSDLVINKFPKKKYNLTFMGTNNFSSVIPLLREYLNRSFAKTHKISYESEYGIIANISSINLITYNSESSIHSFPIQYYKYLTTKIEIDYFEYLRIFSSMIKIITINYDKNYHKKLLRDLYLLDTDYIFLVGYMKIVPESIIEAFSNKIFNFHPSLLPKYKNMMDLSVHEKVIECKEIYSGATLHIVTVVVDGGSILMQRNVRVVNDAIILKGLVQKKESEMLCEFIRFLDYYDPSHYNKHTYKSSGVDINKGNEFVGVIRDITKNQNIGGFSACHELSDGSKIVATTDGVGSKLELARKMNDYTNIGIDLVAMCVNDLLVMGAKPLFFLDYYATHKLDLEVSETIIKSIVDGCNLSNMKLIGGETAEMPHTYEKNKIDLAGFCVGLLDSGMPNYPLIDKVKTGNTILYIPSDGMHSNGFSLVNKLEGIPPRILKLMLKPTRIYYEFEYLFKHFSDYILGVAHITGGGLLDNIPRILPKNKSFEIQNTWDVQEEFHYIYENTNMTEEDMYKTYNLGIGMVIVMSDKFNVEISQWTTMSRMFEMDVLGQVIDGNKPILTKIFEY